MALPFGLSGPRPFGLASSRCYFKESSRGCQANQHHLLDKCHQLHNLQTLMRCTPRENLSSAPATRFLICNLYTNMI